MFQTTDCSVGIHLNNNVYVTLLQQTVLPPSYAQQALMRAQCGSTESAAESVGSSGYGGDYTTLPGQAPSMHACLSRQSTVCTISSIDEGVELNEQPSTSTVSAFANYNDTG